ncbi:hypothetical protein [Nonomuraea cavernae]|uniref:Uncharacterized protein n=1 Tax=Nonomuraea cavernae TaxID=2045107 RepID=A0A918DEZ2_9ACTN|nr:hypothetical protein [Nonomuraea cavernae]MCA2184225.1 hypothetical protein [Nonomuraea cavernae]GGO62692.1 hypothetical protein GCM10012289_07950 [Nonomuraea cavernae]
MTLAPAAGAESTTSQKVSSSPADPDTELATTENGEEPLDTIAPEEYLARLAQNGVIVSAEERSRIMASSCWIWTAYRGGKNRVGQWLWKYFQRMDYCRDGSRITSAHWYTRWAEVYMVGWSFKGHESLTSNGGRGSTQWRKRTQGVFCLVPYVSCIQESHPWVDMTVYGNGGSSFSAGG